MTKLRQCTPFLIISRLFNGITLFIRLRKQRVLSVGLWKLKVKANLVRWYVLLNYARCKDRSKSRLSM